MKNQWTNDAGKHIAAFSSSGSGGISQSWDDGTTDSPNNHRLEDDPDPDFSSNGGYFTFGGLSDSARQGKHYAYVKAWSSNGGQSSIASSGWYGFDNQAPTVTITSGHTNGSTYSTQQQVKWDISDPDSGIYKWGQAWDSDPPQQYDSSDGWLYLPLGTHTLHVHTWDNAGNDHDWTFGPFTYKSGTLLRGQGESTVHLVQDGVRRAFSTPEAFEDWNEKVSDILFDVARPDIEQYTWAPPIPHLIWDNGADIFWVEDGMKRNIVNIDIFNGMGFSLNDIVTVSQSRLDSYPTWNNLSSIEPRLTVMEGPAFSDQSGWFVNNQISATFTVRNITSSRVHVQGALVSVRGPSLEIADFPLSPSFDLDPNQDYTFTASRSFGTIGQYTYNVSFLINGDQWHMAVVSGLHADTPGTFYIGDTPPAPTVTFDETNKNQWFGPSDLNKDIVRWHIDGSAGSFSSLWDADPISASQTTARDGALTFASIPNDLREGQHTAYTRTWNINQGQSALYSSAWYGYDSQPPVVSITSGQTAKSTYVLPQTIEWNIVDSGSGLDHWGCSWDSDVAGTVTDAHGASILPAGTHILHVHSFDKLGNNVDATFGPFTYTPDITPPTGKIEVPASDDQLATGLIAVSGWVKDAGTPTSGLAAVSIQVDGIETGTTTWPVSRADHNIGFTSTLDSSPLSPGPHVISLHVIDKAGNAANINRTIRIPSVPKLGSISPASTAVGASQLTMTVNGIGFAAGSVVQLDNTPLATTFISGTKLTAIVPSLNLATAASVKISVHNGTISSVNSLPFVVSNFVPTLTAVSPTSARIGTATTLSITGTHFVKDSIVICNNIAVATTYQNAGRVLAAIPSTFFTKSGSVVVVVRNPAPGGGVSNSLNLTVVAPKITQLILSKAVTFGPATVTATIRLDGPAVAGGTVVTCTSSSSAATIPTVRIPAGETVAVVPVTLKAVETDTAATITAATGGGSLQGVLSIKAPILTHLTASPSSARSGQPVTITAELGTPAPIGGSTIALSSNSAIVSVGAGMLVVPAGAQSASIVVTPNGATAQSNVILTATRHGISTSTTLAVLPPTLSKVSLNTVSVFSSSSVTGTVTLTGGAFAPNQKISLKSSSTSLVVPATLIFQTGQSSATFPVTLYPVAADTVVTITATGGSVVKTATITIKQPVLSALGVSPTTVKSGGAITLTVKISAPAPAGGSPVAVTSDSGAVVIPGGVVNVPFNATSTIVKIYSTAVFAETPVTLTATLGGISISKLVTITP